MSQKQGEPEIAHHVDAKGGRYVIALADGQEAEMTYRRRGDQVIVIDHTFVPPSARGRGLAEKLVKRGVADARATGVKIVPLCSYAAVQFRRHSEWADLQAD